MASISIFTQISLQKLRFSSTRVPRAHQSEFSPKNAYHFLAPLKFSGKSLGISGLNEILQRGSVEFCVAKSAAADAEGHDIEISNKGCDKPTKSFVDRFPALVTGFFFFTCFVSVVHELVGVDRVVYYLVSGSKGVKKGATIDRELLSLLTPVAFCRALGRVVLNVLFGVVAVSFTHTTNPHPSCIDANERERNGA